MFDFAGLKEILSSSFELNLSSVLLAILVGLLYLSFYDLNGATRLPGPSLRQLLPNGELFPMLRDSHNTLRVLLKLSDKYGQVFQTWMGPRHMVVTSNPADVAQILSGTDDFPRSDDQLAVFDSVVPGGLFTMPKAVHLAARKHLKDKFNFSILEHCHSYLTGAVSELCEELHAKAISTASPQLKGSINILPVISTASFRIIISIVFGHEISRQERVEFHGWVGQSLNEMLKNFLGYPVRQVLSPFGSQNKLNEARTHIYATSDTLISRRLKESPAERASRPADTLDAIISLGGDNMRNIISETVEFAVAGSHTTALTLAWSIYEICRNKSVETRVLKEVDENLASRPPCEPLKPDDVEGMSYLYKVWKETLRLHPPAPFLMRKATRDVALRGSQVNLQKGTHAMAFIIKAQTSSDLWHDPNSFIPERWGRGMQKREGDKVPSGSYTPFSMGQRSCLGKFLADYEGVLVLAELYRRFYFTLACDPNNVISSSGWLEEPRYIDIKSGDTEAVGVPVHVKLRE